MLIAILLLAGAGAVLWSREHAPQGLAGGGPGLVGRQWLITTGGERRELSGCFSLQVQAGDSIEIATPGGGGYGPAPNTPTDPTKA